MLDQKSHRINIFVARIFLLEPLSKIRPKIQQRNNVTTIRIKFNLTTTTQYAKTRNDNTEHRFEQFLSPKLTLKQRNRLGPLCLV